jgi:hypothetical protein
MSLGLRSGWKRARFKILQTRLRSGVLWWRHRGLNASDVFLGTFPRSGTHWLRFQLTEILSGEPVDFDRVESMFIGQQRGAASLLNGGARLINTHERYRRDYRKAIYLVRDVRDVAVSLYAYQTGQQGKGFYHIPKNVKTFDDYLPLFLQGRLTHFGSWHDHVNSWLDSPIARNGNLLVLRFEDLRRNPVAELTRAVNFLGQAVDPAIIQRAVANNTVEKMREKEDHSQVLSRFFKQEHRFVRQGSAGGWRNKLSTPQVELINSYAGKALERMGYPTETVLSKPADVKVRTSETGLGSSCQQTT